MVIAILDPGEPRKHPLTFHNTSPKGCGSLHHGNTGNAAVDPLSSKPRPEPWGRTGAEGNKEPSQAAATPAAGTEPLRQEGNPAVSVWPRSWGRERGLRSPWAPRRPPRRPPPPTATRGTDAASRPPHVARYPTMCALAPTRGPAPQEPRGSRCALWVGTGSEPCVGRARAWQTLQSVSLRLKRVFLITILV